MSYKKKLLLTSLAVFVIALAVGKFSGKGEFTPLNVLGTAIGSLILAHVLVKLFFSGKKPSEKVAERGATPLESPLAKALKSLEGLNLRIRLDSDLLEDILAEAEGVIDKLGDLLPRLNSEYPTSELTYVGNRMATEYLPSILDVYLQLSTGDRASKTVELKQSLNGLSREIGKITGLLDGQKLNEFDKEAMFLRHKFFGETIEA